MNDTTPDDGSEGRGPEGSNGQRMKEGLKRRLDAIGDWIEGVEESVGALQETVNRLESRLDTQRRERQDRIAELEDKIAELDERTDMLQFVERADEADGEARSMALLQHLRRKAEKRRRKDETPTASVSKQQAESALHYPDIDRSTYYSDMQRVERWIGDTDVCEYDDGVLRLDLSAGTLRLPRPRDNRGGSTTEENGVGVRNSGATAGYDTSQTKT